MRYIDSPSNDAFFNMALEEYVFESLPRTDTYFMLWQNRNAIVVGKYQNTIEEINAEYVRDHDISVVRRLSGGGAMYQDMGNLNFTFVVDQNAAKPLDFEIFTQPVVHALAQIGVRAETGSRNDILIDGKKFSGNAQYNKQGRTMHHGTLLFDSDLSVIGAALNVKPDKIASKGVKSVRSRVTNIKSVIERPITLPDFKAVLLQHMFEGNALTPYTLTDADLAAVHHLRDEKYATWAWNYGRSPAYTLRREHRFPFGGVTMLMDVRNGVIQAISFEGDFFGNGDIQDLSGALLHTALQEKALRLALSGIDVGYYISGMNAEILADFMVFGA